MPPDPPGRTVTLPQADSGGVTVTRAAPVASGFNEELRQLLRSRLLLFQHLTIVYAVLLLVMTVLIPGESQPQRDPRWIVLAIVIALALIGTIALARSPGMSLRALRQWELFQFGSQAVINGLFRFAALALTTPETPVVGVGFLGAVSLFGIMTLILAYGVLIPNTRRRSLVVVLGLTAVPFVALAAAVAVNPTLRWGHCWPLLFQAAANLLIPAAIAVFAAARADALQRRAFEAEKRADELGPYTLKGKLGTGGMGEVFLAEHRLLKRPCAVKFIRPELAANSATVARFEREVQAVTGLTHFNTVRVYDYGRADDGSFYYVMEYLDGPSLESLVRRVGPLDPGRAVYMLRQLCGALAEAHSAGLVHRDIKPGNILVVTLGGQHDVAKLLDFGLVQDLATEDNRLTAAGMVLGTPAYMCPEQASGSVVVDARGDLYALGAVAFFMLTGRPPFEARTVGEYLTAHLTRTPQRVTELRPDVSGELADIVARCLAKNPGDRFQSADALSAALAGCACAASWSPTHALAWWNSATTKAGLAAVAPTRTFEHGEGQRP